MSLPNPNSAAGDSIIGDDKPSGIGSDLSKLFGDIELAEEKFVYLFIYLFVLLRRFYSSLSYCYYHYQLDFLFCFIIIVL